MGVSLSAPPSPGAEERGSVATCCPCSPGRGRAFLAHLLLPGLTAGCPLDKALRPWVWGTTYGNSSWHAHPVMCVCTLNTGMCMHVCARTCVGMCAPAMHTGHVCARIVHMYVCACVWTCVLLPCTPSRVHVHIVHMYVHAGMLACVCRNWPSWVETARGRLCAGVTVHHRCVFRSGYLGLHPKDRPRCSVTQSRLTLCDPVDCSTPGFPVLHHIPELAQTQVHRVGDASNHLILCRPLLLLPPIPPSIRVFSNESVLHVRWPQYWSFSFIISPSISPYIMTKPKPWSVRAGGRFVASDDSWSATFAAEPSWPSCGDTWLMAGCLPPALRTVLREDGGASACGV